MARRAVPLVLVALAGLAGCRGDAPPRSESRAGAAAAPGAATPAAEACGGLTAGEASRILDQPSRYRRAAGGGADCSLEPASGDAFRGVSVDYVVTRGDPRAYAFLAAQKQSEPVPGVGDKARWLGAGRTGGNLVAVAGTEVVSVTIRDFRPGADVRATARALARRLLAH